MESVFGVSHVDLPVRDLQNAELLYANTLGFRVKHRGDGWIDLDTGTCALRLIATRSVEHPVTLRVQSGDVEKTLKALERAGAKVLYHATRTSEQTLIAQVVDRDGNGIIVWRELTEDEYDFVPELPKQLTWMPDAERLMLSLLSTVPALFRALARRKVVRVAEILAEDTRVVGRSQVIRGFILASAKITRYRLRKPLQDHGIDPDHYREEFEAEA